MEIPAKLLQYKFQFLFALILSVTLIALFFLAPRFLTILAYFWPLFLSTALFLFAVLVFGKTSPPSTDAPGGDVLPNTITLQFSQMHECVKVNISLEQCKINRSTSHQSVHTILNPQKPSSTAAQKPPLPDEEVMRSNRVDQHVSSGTTSPSPQAGARRKPLSPLKRSSWSSSEDEKASSSSNSPSFSPFLQPPPPPPFEIRPQKHKLYARIQSDHSSSCDSPDPMSRSPDINVKSEHFISKVKADLEEQGRRRSNLAGPTNSKTRRKKEEHV